VEAVCDKTAKRKRLSPAAVGVGSMPSAREVLREGLTALLEARGRAPVAGASQSERRNEEGCSRVSSPDNTSRRRAAV
jgi:hypothetical protein